MFELRDYQKLMIDGVDYDFRAGKQRVCLEGPCGCGKTVIMAWMSQASRARNNNVLFVVHRQELIDQSSETFRAIGITHGVISAGCRHVSREQIQVASVQTLARRLDIIASPQLIILDECHHATARTWRKLLEQFPDAFVVGLTATPERMGGQGLGDVFDSLVLGPTVKQLIEWGNLAPFKYFAPPPPADMDGVRVKCGDYVQSDVTAKLDKPEIIGDLIQHYKKLANGMRAVCYCASIEHSKHTAAAFMAAGIPAAHIDGETPKLERKKIIDSFRNDEIKILTNVDLISEGFDVPAMQAVILARPTQSLTLHVQQSMRPMRPDKNNPDKVAIIIDHVGNCYRHGLPDEEREWSLEGKKKRISGPREVSVRQCPQCFGAHRPAPVCPYCGYRYVVAEKSDPEQVTGELITVEEVERKRKRQEVGRARSITDLEQIALRRGYSLRWINKIADVKGINKSGANRGPNYART